VTGVVFDSSAVVTFLIQERGWQAIHRVLKRVGDAVMAGPALTEVIAVTRRKGNQSSGEQIWEALSAAGVRIEHTTEHDLIRAAELIEISGNKPGPPHTTTGAQATLSLGDALILAIAERLDYQVLTYDTYWDWMVGKGLSTAQVVVP
jgi:PIN domain nuclease of toxin-antitoxin system